MVDIHPRRMRMVFSNYTSDQLDYEPIVSQENIGRFEYLYGYPTNIDKVWEDRENYQNKS
jgi:hypothetical protein